ncbi:hypothetical protein WA026_020155 [Henosepilachna vigintioctopunctata]|uniref:peptidylprolyl isomerase n=1 Tax=Henosepilachna vigintioctopunctata TaxID=420089 RepID=A0AAW1U2G7_9CUCU
MSQNNTKPINKKILYAGNQIINFRNGTKVHFHFKTEVCNTDGTVLDDSRKMGQGKPVELIIGKKFKLEVWESMLKGMQLNEVSQFTVDANLVLQYPFVSKTLRDANKPKEQRSRGHCCSLTLQTEGIGYDDLNKFLREPEDLKFTFEVVKVEQPEQYEKEVWQLSEKELTLLVPTLKQQGNEKFKQQKFKEASELYAKALGVLEQLMIKEKPHDHIWNQLNERKVPLLLNYAQCLLINGDYYGTIEHCTSVLTIDKDNVKAYYRRGKAHVGAWNFVEAKEDFRKVSILDPSMEAVIRKEFENLKDLITKKNNEDKKVFTKLFE